MLDLNVKRLKYTLSVMATSQQSFEEAVRLVRLGPMPNEPFGMLMQLETHDIKKVSFIENGAVVRTEKGEIARVLSRHPVQSQAAVWITSTGTPDAPVAATIDFCACISGALHVSWKVACTNLQTRWLISYGPAPFFEPTLRNAAGQPMAAHTRALTAPEGVPADDPHKPMGSITGVTMSGRGVVQMYALRR